MVLKATSKTPSNSNRGKTKAPIIVKYEVFKEACKYTMDKDLQAILMKCAQKKGTLQFRFRGSNIVTAKGNTYSIDKSPMEICNIIHDIIHEHEQPSITARSEVSARSSRSTSVIPFTMEDNIYAYAIEETARLGRESYYADILASCIFTGIFVGDITNTDIITKNSKIIEIKGLNTSIPSISKYSN